MPSIEAERLGSDHCPVAMSCTVKFETDSTTNLGVTAALCAKNFVEFSGIQQSIKSFVVRSQTAIENRDAGNDALTCTGTSVSGVPRPKKRINRGQQSITSFFSHTGSKRKSPSSGKDSWTKEGSTVYEMLSRGVRIVEKSAKRKPTEERKLEWQQVLSGRPPPTPVCYCGQATVLRSVTKTNENWGRKFYVCTKPAVS